MNKNNDTPQEKRKLVLDENPDVKELEPLPISGQLEILRYRTLKKNNVLGWWSAIVLLIDHNKKQICYYRWRKKGDEWKRDKKLPIRSHKDWLMFKNAVESFLKEID